MPLDWKASLFKEICDLKEDKVTSVDIKNLKKDLKEELDESLKKHISDALRDFKDIVDLAIKMKTDKIASDFDKKSTSLHQELSFNP